MKNSLACFLLKKGCKDIFLINTLPFFSNMRNLFVVYFLLFFTWISNAQITDDFSDGNFDANPAWEGDINNFVVNQDFELQLNAPDAGNSTLFVSSQIPDSTIWEFYFNLGFAPSNSNKLFIYLQADNSDLPSSDGYYLEIGENGSNDVIKFYKRQGTDEVLLASGATNVVNSDPVKVRLRIERTSIGDWSFLADYEGGNNFELDFGIQDDTWLGGDFFFGFHCEYTATRTDKFFFDDISIQSLIPDSSAPNLVSAFPDSETELRVFFNENLDENYIQTNNFDIDNGIGNPIFAELDLDDKTLVLLTLGNPLQNQTDYTLTTTNIADEAGNIAGNQSTAFTFTKTDEALPFDILINEILADPTPSLGLPPFEFVELYNRSQKTIDLAEFGFDAGSTPQLLPSYQLSPGEYLILCDEDNQAAFQSFGKVLGISSFPALVNSGDDLTLTDLFGEVIHAVSYSEEWFIDLNKREGGWSLEMISPNNICEEGNNWRGSESLSGGTPGTQNSIFNNSIDTESPDLISVFVDAQKPKEVQLFFNENMDKLSAEKISNYSLSNSLVVENAFLNPFDKKNITLNINTALEPKTIYEITIKNDLKDCLGNPIGIANKAEFGLPESPEHKDIVVNEILFNPEVGGVDFVELYNRSSKILNIADLSIGNLQVGVDTSILSVTQNFLFLPETYVVITESPSYIRNRYLPKNPQWLVENDLPAFNNDLGNVTIISNSNNPPIIIDAFDYDKDFHHVLLEDENGVSLERINPDAESQESSNWHSAAQSVGFATPTYQNSQFVGNTEVSDGIITIPEKSFSPNGDGFKDFLQINYQLDIPDYLANVKIFDSAGRLVRDLMKNELIGTEGTFKWDGSTNENRLARMGVYIIYVQIFTPNGQVKEYKETCALVEGK